ncbi:MipA/OmpV family protein [Paraburkholderia sp. MMS20-SJTR3]|uniref:MipA/OmpV family protein n=1 Tax=Paraburkholderia sejongensis TaxID=2886946 RepID=A0ABS8JS25_9BURK|nr:MipA/OmpV family protein [Paraburkholderia sp. MMS20-SJTR3]MCC8392705.1 MipA/OmpV family protein [Paraburkholderia sp. MMS20-SJTR3]
MIDVSNPRMIKVLMGSALSLFALAAMADDTLGLSEGLYSVGAPEVTQGTGVSTSPWRFALGAGVVNMPKYPGASGTKWEVVPAVSVNYDRFFLGANPDAASVLALGAYLYRDSNWRVGAAITYDFIEPRSESDDARLHGLGDVKRTAHAELFGVYTYQFVTARASVLTDIAGNDRGTVATFDLLGRYEPIPQLTLSAGPGLTWASSKYNETYFGVTSEQSARSGLPTYSAGSGLNQVRFSINGVYRIAARWNVGASASFAWLRGDATDSPITQKTSQITYGLFANYLF